MTTQLITQKTIQIPVMTLFAAWCVLASTPSQGQEQIPAKHGTQYRVSNLNSLGGTSSGGNSINNRTWVAGYSRLPDNQSRHAALWRHRSLLDLGTLGGPNSSVTWNVKNTEGIIVGISQTAAPEPLGEAWSSATFYGPPNNVGFINLGFVWEDGQMRGLPNFPGGNNGFATGANNLGQVVEGDIVHGFIWTKHHGIQPLLALQGRTPEHVDSEAYGINAHGQVVGTSCDANFVDCRAVIWDHSAVPTDLNDLKTPGYPARLESAKDINNKGEITGRAIDANNVRTAYLAEPARGH
jgi:probable HAF family extracellular repeat protein